MAGLYMHIPFCANKCSYCDFYSCTLLHRRDAFVEALLGEMRERKDYLCGEPLRTIYIGGGTPSLLSPEQIGRILGAVGDNFDVQAEEITLEANPDDLTAGDLAALAETPIDRLSIGVQSFVDGHLRLMNRRHTAAQAVKAIRMAQEAGFGNISADLIFGVPGMRHDEWEHNIDTMLSLGVQHISAYHLTIEEGTPMAAMAARGEISPVDEGVSERQYHTLRRKLAVAGFEHYEISNFALPGFRARHNSSYWAGEPYLGLGPAAHSYDGRERRWCIPDAERYIAETTSEGLYEAEILGPRELYNEYVMVRLRTAEGVDSVEMERKFGNETASKFVRTAEKFLLSGALRAKNSRIFIPEEEFLVSDHIISDFFEA
jgi:oxygen-independent coproporphyrinogen-3 oxidase